MIEYRFRLMIDYKVWHYIQSPTLQPNGLVIIPRARSIKLCLQEAVGRWSKNVHFLSMITK